MMGFEFEKALKLLVLYFPEEAMKKPTLFHSVRVGAFLWNNGYKESIQIAGLLHDALEDTDIPETVIQDNFGYKILEIVKANSKNISLEKSEILEDIVRRCSESGIDAMIVKTADVYDNFLFYVKEGNISEIERCKTLAHLISEYKLSMWDDSIFEILKVIQSYETK